MIGTAEDIRSPRTGLSLAPDTPHSLATSDATERWPVIDAIPFLRAGREALAARVLAALDGGDRVEATALLLQDRDDWAHGPPASLEACRDVAAQVDTLSFRDAMRRLGFGPVGDYLAHRWSDPTYLSGLALAEAHWRPGARVVELACGTGAFLAAFLPHAARVTGADVVWAKIWLARHFVAPAARLLCFDAAHPWPLPPGSADLAFCHDAFYFLPEKPAIARRLRALVGEGGAILVGHAHNALAENPSAGAPLDPDGYAALFDDPVLFDDRELTASLLDRRAPRPDSAAELAGAPAIALASGAGPARAVAGLLDRPRPGARLRRNPLYQGGARARVHFPSALYAREYGPLATYPEEVEAPLECLAGQADDPLVRRRVLLELPPRW